MDLRPFMQGVAAALGPAIRAFFLTAATMSLLAVVLAGSSYAIAADGSALRGALAAIVALALSAVLGFTLSWKRALGAGILQVVRSKRLGGMLVTAVFERLLGVSDQAEVGARGGRVAQAVEGVPINEAVKRLRLAVIHRVQAAPRGGGLRGLLRRKIEAQLLKTIEALTLARFRNEAHQKGGIDLVKARDELAQGVDDLVTDEIEGTLLVTTLLLVGAAAAASLGAAAGIQYIPL
ncbi:MULTISPECIES: hypothetical protein [Sorangium]|uniref:Uncharacterized protein n=1 Tax=Sorangium cellulosum TaxID=56 RepID=A0A4P2QN94_SORCE|nr:MULTISPECIES: hypothetical protein [Sorangium]AUX31584.1 hypothetical protein SOCE836_037150 [Sorangium cellulosum]WCQ90961.1 hypothetical protein NQZ70_03676 [Sorangium sp. Soce836]